MKIRNFHGVLVLGVLVFWAGLMFELARLGYGDR